MTQSYIWYRWKDNVIQITMVLILHCESLGEKVMNKNIRDGFLYYLENFTTKFQAYYNCLVHTQVR